jgi:hypothetical protein
VYSGTFHGRRDAGERMRGEWKSSFEPQRERNIGGRGKRQ